MHTRQCLVRLWYTLPNIICQCALYFAKSQVYYSCVHIDLLSFYIPSCGSEVYSVDSVYS